METMKFNHVSCLSGWEIQWVSSLGAQEYRAPKLTERKTTAAFSLTGVCPIF